MFRPSRGRGDVRHAAGEIPCEGLEAFEGGGGGKYRPPRAAARAEHLRDARVGYLRGDVRRLLGRHGGVFQGAVQLQ